MGAGTCIALYTDVALAFGQNRGDLTCLEDCPDVCVQNRGKWVPFWPQSGEGMELPPKWV